MSNKKNTISNEVSHKSSSQKYKKQLSISQKKTSKSFKKETSMLLAIVMIMAIVIPIIIAVLDLLSRS